MQLHLVGMNHRGVCFADSYCLMLPFAAVTHSGSQCFHHLTHLFVPEYSQLMADWMVQTDEMHLSCPLLEVVQLLLGCYRHYTLVMEPPQHHLHWKVSERSPSSWRLNVEYLMTISLFSLSPDAATTSIALLPFGLLGGQWARIHVLSWHFQMKCHSSNMKKSPGKSQAC